MDVIECIRERCLAERFLNKPVANEVLRLLLELATHAPSAGNLQPWCFILVKAEELRAKLAGIALHRLSIKRAPVCIVVCVDLERLGLRYGEKGRVYAEQDASFACLTLLLAAHAMGLACDLVRAFDRKAVKELLSLPEGVEPMMLVPLGYASELLPKPERIPIESLCWLDSYGKEFKVGSKKILA